MRLNRSSITICLLVLSTGFCGVLVSFSGLYLYLSPKLPAVETLREVKFQTPLRVYSADNQLIYEYGDMREPISFKDAPPLLIKALIAIEDDRFYFHNGVDFEAFLRAASQYLTPGSTQTGGSTLTMQLAKNFFLDNTGSLIYKANQIILALHIEKELTKEEILELYINHNFLGNHANGVGAAAHVYYGKSIDQLSLAQLAMIAGTFQLPSARNAVINPSGALARRNRVLANMLKLGDITQEQYDTAVAEPVTAKIHGRNIDLNAMYVAEMAREEMVKRYGKESAYEDGYQVHVTVDSKLQKAAQDGVVKGLLAYDQRHGYRGPELHLEPHFIDTETLADIEDIEQRKIYQFAQHTDEDTSTDQNEDPLTRNFKVVRIDYEPWLQELASMSTYANLRPAVIMQAQGKTIEALLKDGRIIAIPWEHGASDARPYISANSRGPTPKNAEDIVTMGDVVWVHESDPGEWYLSQIPEVQGALVALNPENGAIRALVGGFDYNQSQYNRVTQMKRQPGSNFKPLMYTAALENGYSAGTIMNDIPFTRHDPSIERNWRPENDDGEYEGPMRLREALYRSRNVVSVWLLDSLGTYKAFKDIDRFGIAHDDLPKNDLSLALGTYELTPLQLATAYAIFANGGYKVEPYFIDRIEDQEGEVLYEAAPLTVCRECEQRDESTSSDPVSEQGQANPLSSVPTQDANSAADRLDAQLLAELEQLTASDSIATPQPQEPKYPPAPRVIDERTVYIIDDILKDVISPKGTGRDAVALHRSDLAGKTGTTNNSTDTWFSGFNQYLVATTWVGFDQHTPLGSHEYGGRAALPVWMEFMRVALKGVPEQHRAIPDGLVTVSINSKTGKRTSPSDPNAVFEIFKVENAPPEEPGVDTNELLFNKQEVHPDDLF